MHTSANRAAWLEIDLTAARDNFRLIRERVGGERKLIAVIKANAYGHGAVAIARALIKEGADIFAVATVDELLELRQAGINTPVLIFGFVPAGCYEEVIRQNGIFTIYDKQQAAAINAAALKIGKKAAVHIKLDSGLHRLGFFNTDDDAREVLDICRLPQLDIQGAFSHFAFADSDDKSYSQQQQQLFAGFIEKCRGLGLEFPLLHMANSAAISDLPGSWFGAVRTGITLYGCYASETVERIAGIRPIMQVKAEIVRLARIAAGSFVSYGCTWRAERESIIATLPLGYADGVSRLLANNGFVLIAGRRAPIIGLVCMDQLMADVTDIAAETELGMGTQAVFIGCQGAEQISVEEVAARARTINYEILCHLGARLPRVYVCDEENQQENQQENQHN